MPANNRHHSCLQQSVKVQKITLLIINELGVLKWRFGGPQLVERDEDASRS